jgi:hypothetical protein
MTTRTPFATLNVNTTPVHSTQSASKAKQPLSKHQSAMRFASDKTRTIGEATPVTKKRGRADKAAQTVAKKQGIVPNDEVIIDYPNGDRYSGQVKDGKKHGSGTLICNNDYRYTGEFKDDEIHGSGTYIYANGDIYTLTYDPSGQSRLRIEYATHDVAELTFDNVTGVGAGKTVYFEGGEYKGAYLNGQPHGKGVRTFVRGSYYTGVMEGGAPHGQGILHIPKLEKEDCSFLCWEIGNYRTGHTYIGTFEHGRFTGKDNQIHSADGEKYVGGVLHELPHGRGKIFFSKGGSYDGEFDAGKKHGSGMMKSTPWDRTSLVTFENDVLVTSQAEESSSE